MHAEPLVRMANQIGVFFAAMPQRDEALEEVAQHLRKFWDPRMRKALLAHVDATGGAGLNDTLAAAIAQHRALIGH